MKGIIFDSELGGGGVRLAYKELPAGDIRASQGTFSSSEKNLGPRDWSAPTPGQYTCIFQKYSKIFSETTWPIKAQFYRKHLWEGGINVLINTFVIQVT